MSHPLGMGGHQIFAVKFRCLDLLLRGFHKRQTHNEGCAQTFTRTLGADCAAVYFNQVTNDCQSQPDSSMRPGARYIGLTEEFEYMWQKITLDSFAGITHRDQCMRGGAQQLNLYRAISGREFHGIRQKVPDYLPQTIDIAVDD